MCKIKKNHDQDFMNASLIAKAPFYFIINILVTIIFIFLSGMVINLIGKNQPTNINEVICYACLGMLVMLLCFPFMFQFISLYLSLTTIRTDINFGQSMRLTWRLQRSLERQVGSDFGAQGRLAKLSNIRRLGSFVWVKTWNKEVQVAIRQDTRQDVNDMVTADAMQQIASDIAEITGTTFTSYETKIIKKKVLFFEVYRKYQVASLN